MKIKTSSREIDVASVIGENVKIGSQQYPAVKFVMPNGITAEDLAALSEGSFTIVEVDAEGNETEYVHEGYNSIREVSVTIAQVNSIEQQIVDLEAQLAALRSEAESAKTELSMAKAESDATNILLIQQNEEYKKEIEALEAENADLLFSKLTNSNLPATSTSN